MTLLKVLLVVGSPVGDSSAVYHDSQSGSTTEAVRKLLTECSYQVTVVHSLKDAIAMQSERLFDLFLVDHEPDLGISAYPVIQAITNEDTLCHIPVIVMSSKDSQLFIAQCLLLGAADYLVKPLRSNELNNLWAHVWRRSRIMQEKGHALWEQTLPTLDNHPTSTGEQTSQPSFGFGESIEEDYHKDSREHSEHLRRRRHFKRKITCVESFEKAGDKKSKHGHSICSPLERRTIEQKGEEAVPVSPSSMTTASVQSAFQAYSKSGSRSKVLVSNNPEETLVNHITQHRMERMEMQRQHEKLSTASDKSPSLNGYNSAVISQDPSLYSTANRSSASGGHQSHQQQQQFLPHWQTQHRGRGSYPPEPVEERHQRNESRQSMHDIHYRHHHQTRSEDTYQTVSYFNGSGVAGPSGSSSLATKHEVLYPDRQYSNHSHVQKIHSFSPNKSQEEMDTGGSQRGGVVVTESPKQSPYPPMRYPPYPLAVMQRSSEQQQQQQIGSSSAPSSSSDFSQMPRGYPQYPPPESTPARSTPSHPAAPRTPILSYYSTPRYGVEGSALDHPMPTSPLRVTKTDTQLVSRELHPVTIKIENGVHTTTPSSYSSNGHSNQHDRQPSKDSKSTSYGAGVHGIKVRVVQKQQQQQQQQQHSQEKQRSLDAKNCQGETEALPSMGALSGVMKRMGMDHLKNQQPVNREAVAMNDGTYCRSYGFGWGSAEPSICSNTAQSVEKEAETYLREKGRTQKPSSGSGATCTRGYNWGGYDEPRDYAGGGGNSRCLSDGAEEGGNPSQLSGTQAHTRCEDATDKQNHRQEALKKFQAKKRFRSYEKKILYDARKHLAEQRPRVNGKFIKRGDCSSGPAPTCNSAVCEQQAAFEADAET